VLEEVVSLIYVFVGGDVGGEVSILAAVSTPSPEEEGEGLIDPEGDGLNDKDNEGLSDE
jgi:hypothetical protein